MLAPCLVYTSTKAVLYASLAVSGASMPAIGTSNYNVPMSETIPVHRRRRAPRYHLGGVVELTDLESGRMNVALVRAVSLYGCFVKTEMAVKKAARVALKITHSETQFSTTGRVVNCIEDHTNRGFGIEFTEISPIDKAHLEACLAELAAAYSLPPVPNP
jgi:hypothetical protein